MPRADGVDDPEIAWHEEGTCATGIGRIAIVRRDDDQVPPNLDRQEQLAGVAVAFQLMAEGGGRFCTGVQTRLFARARRRKWTHECFTAQIRFVACVASRMS